VPGGARKSISVTSGWWPGNSGFAGQRSRWRWAARQIELDGGRRLLVDQSECDIPKAGRSTSDAAVTSARAIGDSKVHEAVRITENFDVFDFELSQSDRRD
jgi:hypothetical protein